MKRLISVSALLIVGLTSAAQAEYNTLIGCYAYNHDQCFPNGGENVCEGDWYETALDGCHLEFPNASGGTKQLIRSKSLASPMTSTSKRKVIRID
ncbi:hypothetical protein [Devosia sp.]|uniref:hypothetical protein n=1 Tax=Devosia sp. TaxID=1871048 RepID=UPI003A95A41E